MNKIDSIKIGNTEFFEVFFRDARLEDIKEKLDKEIQSAVKDALESTRLEIDDIFYDIGGVYVYDKKISPVVNEISGRINKVFSKLKTS